MTKFQRVHSDRAWWSRGLYLILDAAWASRCSLVEVMGEALDAGVRIVQYRDKMGSMQEAYARAKALRKIAPPGRVMFIVNDRCDLALAVEADGVHLGQQDLPVALARKVLPSDMLIGFSTHNPDQVKRADQEMPDYLGFGPIFSTGTKTDHDPLVGVDGMKDIRSLTTLPVFAIGGIVPESVPRLLEAGADGIAVASGILGASNRREMFKIFMAPFQEEK